MNLRTGRQTICQITQCLPLSIRQLHFYATQLVNNVRHFREIDGNIADYMQIKIFVDGLKHEVSAAVCKSGIEFVCAVIRDFCFGIACNRTQLDGIFFSVDRGEENGVCSALRALLRVDAEQRHTVIRVGTLCAAGRLRRDQRLHRIVRLHMPKKEMIGAEQHGGKGDAQYADIYKYTFFFKHNESSR